MSNKATQSVEDGTLVVPHSTRTAPAVNPALEGAAHSGEAGPRFRHEVGPSFRGMAVRDSGASRSTEREEGFYDFWLVAACRARIESPFRVSR
jgi:hypothetical protein